MLQGLVHHGVLKGARGQHGGYKIGRDRDRISAEDILRAAVDEMRRESGARASRLDQTVARAIKQVEEVFSEALARISLQDLTGSGHAQQRRMSVLLRGGSVPYAGRVARECKPGSVGLGVARAAIRCYMALARVPPSRIGVLQGLFACRAERSGRMPGSTCARSPRPWGIVQRQNSGL
jgi:Iron-dependent Transcriptional regulator